MKRSVHTSRDGLFDVLTHTIIDRIHGFPPRTSIGTCAHAECLHSLAVFPFAPRIGAMTAQLPQTVQREQSNFVVDSQQETSYSSFRERANLVM